MGELSKPLLGGDVSREPEDGARGVRGRHDVPDVAEAVPPAHHRFQVTIAPIGDELGDTTDRDWCAGADVVRRERLVLRLEDVTQR